MEWINNTEIVGIVIISMFLIREMFSYLKNKGSNTNYADIKKDIALINQQLNNHMTDYNKCLNRVEESVSKNTDSISIIESSIIRIEANLKK